ncbi:MAG: DUF4142 domain-containing protein [Novosphingobium sp.]
MKHIALIAVSAVALSLSGCGKKADEGAGGMSNADGTSSMAGASPTMAASPGQTFADTAAASDTFEIESSRLAERKASSAAIKKFAAQMIKAHTASTAKLKTAASSASPAIVPSPQLTGAQQQALDAMSSQNGAAFDSAYARAQVDQHQATLDTLKAYAATGDVPPLKAFAGEMVAPVTGHLNMAKGLK